MDQLFIDENLTEESKKYVIGFYQSNDPKSLFKTEMKLIRQYREKLAEEINKNSPYESHLNVSELFVENEHDGYRIPITKYETKNNPENQRIILFIHGGGYCLGSTTTYHLTTSALASQTNSIVFSVNYRLSPEHKIPTHLNDCESALKWIIKNKASISSAKSELGIIGDSAGGQMAAILGHRFRNELNFQILIYPIVHHGGIYDSYKKFTSHCYMLIPEVLKYLAELSVDKNETNESLEKIKKTISVIDYEDFRDLPNCLIIAAELDPLVDDSIHYHQKLIKNSINCDIKILKGLVHGYFSYPHIFKEAFGQTLGFINDFLSKNS
jgi:acetyl esterase